MKYLLLLFVAVSGICLSQAASTTRHPHGHNTGSHHHHHSNGTHPTREPGEKENFSFFYAPKTHKMYIHSGKTCYVATMTADEMKSVHTDAGIRSLELKFLQMLGIATQVANTTLTKTELNYCGHHVNSYFTIP